MARGKVVERAVCNAANFLVTLVEVPDAEAHPAYIAGRRHSIDVLRYGVKDGHLPPGLRFVLADTWAYPGGEMVYDPRPEGYFWQGEVCMDARIFNQSTFRKPRLGGGR